MKTLLLKHKASLLFKGRFLQFSVSCCGLGWTSISWERQQGVRYVEIRLYNSNISCFAEVRLSFASYALDFVFKINTVCIFCLHKKPSHCLYNLNIHEQAFPSNAKRQHHPCHRARKYLHVICGSQERWSHDISYLNRMASASCRGMPFWS